MKYNEFVFVPPERLGALIGEEGKTKKLIEERTGLKIEINSENGEAKIERTDENAAVALKAVDVVKAIATGFAPKAALELLSDDIYFRLIHLEDLVRNDKAVPRQKARLIGTRGKAKRMLEEYTGARISIYNNDVGVIGDAESVEMAAEAIAKLAGGTPHGDVYTDIKKKQQVLI